MSAHRRLLAVGLTVTLGAGCGAITGENLTGTGGRGAGGSGSGTGGGTTGGSGGTTGGSGGITTGCGCTTDYAPVCGTDGVTYPNACSAKCFGYVGVAYQGVCNAGGTDGGPGSCNSDSDCALVSGGCCGEMCVQIGLPVEPSTQSTTVCNVACPAFVAPTCGCVNHQCVLGSGTGGTSCSDLATQYAAELTKAQACDVGASGQCLQAVSSWLSPCGGCATYVTDATVLNEISATWMQQGCNNVVVACPAIACQQPGPGACVAGDGGGGVCRTAAVTPL